MSEQKFWIRHEIGTASPGKIDRVAKSVSLGPLGETTSGSSISAHACSRSHCGFTTPPASAQTLILIRLPVAVSGSVVTNWTTDVTPGAMDGVFFVSDAIDCPA